MSRPLSGRVAVVAGSTRGAGRRIARMLGEAGAIVYGTGRSSRIPGTSIPAISLPRGRSNVDNHARLISNRDLDSDDVVTELAPPPPLGTRPLNARILEWSRVFFDCGSPRP